MSTHDALAILRQTWIQWQKHDVSRIGAALAYYTTFSIAPVLLIATAMAGLVFGPDAARAQVSSQIHNLIGPTGAQAVEAALANAGTPASGALATLIGLVTLFVGATTMFTEIQGALNTMWEAPPSTATGIIPILKSRGLSFAMVLVVGFLLLVSLTLSAVLSGMGDRLASFASVPPSLLQFTNAMVSFIVVTALFAMLFKFLPDVKIAWAEVWIGAVVTSLLFSFGKQVIGAYLGNSAIASAYGAAGSLAVMLVWVYYSSQILLFGAQFTQVYSQHRRAMGAPASGTPPPVEPRPK